MNTVTSLCKAAFTQTDITPDFPVEMIGCYREDQRPKGILYPLVAQLLLFERDDERYALIAIDSLGLTTTLSQELRSKVADALQTRASHVMLNFSHTHSAPAPTSPLNGQQYFRMLCDRTIASAQQARTMLQPCRVAWALGETDIGENRREGCSAVDKRLGALQVADATSLAPIVTLLRVCAHANVLMTHSDKLSSDYFGAARAKLAAHFGSPIMMIQGAAGNIKPQGVDTINGGDRADLERIAEALLQAGMKLRFMPQAVTRLGVVEREIELFSDVPSEETAKEIAARVGMDATDWLSECARLRSQGIREQSQTDCLHFLFINEACLCGVPDEIFTELALAAVQRTASPLLFFNGYTNGCTGYLPHEEEWLKGGYETHDSYLIFHAYHGHVMPFRADTAEMLIATVVEVWNDHHDIAPR